MKKIKTEKEYKELVKFLKKQISELIEEKEKFRNLYNSEYSTNMRLHQVEKDLTMKNDELWRELSANRCGVIRSYEDIIMALITETDVRLENKKLDYKRRF